MSVQGHQSRFADFWHSKTGQLALFGAAAIVLVFFVWNYAN